MTSAGNPAPRYIAAAHTSTMTTTKMCRSGRTMNGAMPNASAVIAATFATGYTGPSPMRTATLSPLMACVPSRSFSRSDRPHAPAPASTAYTATRNWRRIRSTAVIASTAQIDPSA